MIVQITLNGIVPIIDVKAVDNFLPDTHFVFVQNKITNQAFHTMEITNTIMEPILADQIKNPHIYLKQ